MTDHILTEEELMTITQTLFDGRSIHALRWPLVQQLQESHRLQAARIQELEKDVKDLKEWLRDEGCEVPE